MTIVCLLPARNAAEDLPGYFASAARFADAVVALDDGSTDGTGALLAAQPLVRRLLVNPIRPDYRGWNDAANRNALLRAAVDLAPEWIVSIDADERLDPSDAAALRRFVATDALPGIAYGLRCYSMQRDLAHYYPNPIWVYRLFAFAPGQRFSDQVLHFAPIPTSIPRRAYVRTSLRIQHLAGITPERSRARYEKYRQADPECRFWPDYGALLRQPDPSTLREWHPRPPDLPVLSVAPFSAADADVAGRPPEDIAGLPPLSVVVLAGGRPEALERTIVSVLDQATVKPVEIILAAQTGDRDAEGVCRRHPTIRLVHAKGGATPGALRNAALRAASGDAVLFLSGDVSLAPGALAAIVAAHGEGYALVAPAVEDRASTRAAAAIYATVYWPHRPGRPAGISERAPRLCSYRRAVLAEGGGFPEGLRAGEEIVVNRALASRGFLTYRQPAATARFHGDGITPLDLLLRSFRRGGAHAQFLLDAHRERGELIDRRFVRERLPRWRRPRGDRAAGRSGRAASPLVLIANAAAWAGEWSRLVRPWSGNGLVLVARPAGLLLACVTDAGIAVGIALIRFDLPARRATVVTLPAVLGVEGIDGRRKRLDDALGVGPNRRAPGGVVSRFAGQDALGRTFALDLDDVVSFDAAVLGHDPMPTSVEDWLRRLGSPGTMARAVRALDQGGIRSTISKRALLFGLLSVRAFGPAAVAVLQLPTDPAEGSTGAIDGATVDLVRAALATGQRPALASRRDRLRLVEWA